MVKPLKVKLRQRFRCVIFCFIIISIILIFVDYLNIYNPLFTFNIHFNKSGYSTENKLETQYTILFWTELWSNPVKSYNISNLWSECTVHNCEVTSLKENISNSDAVIFHWRDLNFSDMPRRTNMNQNWVLYNLEAPTNTYPLPRDQELDIRFDWTATYRPISDIFVPYGKLIKRKLATDAHHVDLRSKTKMIAWLVSNCKTTSGRETYVNELQKYVSVDVYGDCGVFQCQPKRSNICTKMLAQNYKFYLSFENSICGDYVTEKLFAMLEYDIIPVVFGGADYDILLPPNSYINAMQFKPKELAQYIHEIAFDPLKYNSFFKWKSVYYLEKNLDTVEHLLCGVCEKLNEYNKSYYKRNNSKSLGEIIKWWFESRSCFMWINTDENDANLREITFILHENTKNNSISDKN